MHSCSRKQNLQRSALSYRTSYCTFPRATMRRRSDCRRSEAHQGIGFDVGVTWREPTTIRQNMLTPFSHNCHSCSELLAAAYSMPLPILTSASTLPLISEQTRYLWLDLSMTGGDLKPELSAFDLMMCPLLNTLPVSASNIGFHGADWAQVLHRGIRRNPESTNPRM